MLSKNLWGPPLWQVLHEFSFQFPDAPSPSQQKAAETFVTSALTLLPCEECQHHASMYLAAHELDTSSKIGFATWVLNFHNDVNARLGKKPWTMEQAEKFYLSSKAVMVHPWDCLQDVMNQKRNDSTSSLYKILLFFLLFSLLCLFFVTNQIETHWAYNPMSFSLSLSGTVNRPWWAPNCETGDRQCSQ